MFARAFGVFWLVQIIVIGVWMIVPHPSDSHTLAIWLIAVAGGLLFLPMLHPRTHRDDRVFGNISAVLGIAYVSGLVWAGGGLSSGFELFALWFMPLAVYMLPRPDVIAQVPLVIAGCALGARFEAHAGDVITMRELSGFAVVAAVTVAVDTALAGYIYGHLHDLSERFRRRSIQDALTELANRAGLTTRMAAYRENGQSATAYVVDVDGFKFINDSFGHHTGDALLELLADRLRSHARAGDLLARAGGDEFTLLVDGAHTHAQAQATAERLLTVCDQPFHLDGLETSMSVTVGACLLADAGSVEEALRNADLAMYAAKTTKRGTARLFEPSMREQALSRVTTEHHLRHAIANGELRLVYQPIVSVKTGAVSTFEALLRWRSPTLGDVGPDEFIPIAEQTGLIMPIGRFVLTQAIEQLGRWHADGNHDLTVSINLSPRQLSDEQLPDRISELCQQYLVPPSSICLELTETALMADPGGQSGDMLDQLRAVGVGLALDDFGTGYSSLARLSQLRLSAVKIDRSFINRMLSDPTAAAVVDAVMRMAEPMGVAVIAEGIETADELAKVADLGCRYAQGYLFSRPLEPHDVGRLLNTTQPRLRAV